MERIAVLGGTGALGHALACRWAMAGCSILIGSREADRAEAAAEAVKRAAPGSDVSGLDNLAAADAAGLAVLTVPFASQASVLRRVAEALQGKILIDTTVPLVPPRLARAQLPPEGSAALIAQSTLGEGVRVVSAFHNVAAAALREGGAVEGDVLVFGDDRDARAKAVALARLAGLRGLHAGALANSVAAEALTSVLIFLNRHYGGHGGLRIVGLERAEDGA